ncbi:MAG: 3-isopropylmalate dehydratase small subunit [Polyangiaceae bacterium]|nr:3-isopropylmalate dehydratase small subunit [Polyangiaceae bacterium]
MDDAKRIVIEGTGIPLRGNDIDTDRIVPARYLKSVVFEGLGAHAFEDDRAQLRAADKLHPFDDPRFASGQVLLVNQNFGCGSSREHAPQALLRYGKGIRAIVGESFADIFRGNCVALGIPCVTVDAAAAERLIAAVEQDPALVVRLDLQTRTVLAGGRDAPVGIDDGTRAQFIDGRWDAVAELLGARDAIFAKARSIPYFSAYGAHAER